MSCWYGTPRNGESRCATDAGSRTTFGLAYTVTESSETASSVPLRSVIVPRRAGTSTCSTCWASARPRKLLSRTVPSHRARTAASARRLRKNAKRRPTRRSTRVTLYGVAVVGVVVGVTGVEVELVGVVAAVGIVAGSADVAVVVAGSVVVVPASVVVVD